MGNFFEKILPIAGGALGFALGGPAGAALGLSAAGTLGGSGILGGGPDVPDPAAIAAAQAEQNRQTALFNQQLGMMNQYNPFGSLTYQQVGTWDDGTPRYEQQMQYSPQIMALMDQALRGISQPFDLGYGYANPPAGTRNPIPLFSETQGAQQNGIPSIGGLGALLGAAPRIGALGAKHLQEPSTTPQTQVSQQQAEQAEADQRIMALEAELEAAKMASAHIQAQGARRQVRGGGSITGGWGLGTPGITAPLGTPNLGQLFGFIPSTFGAPGGGRGGLGFGAPGVGGSGSPSTGFGTAAGAGT